MLNASAHHMDDKFIIVHLLISQGCEFKLNMSFSVVFSDGCRGHGINESLACSRLFRIIASGSECHVKANKAYKATALNAPHFTNILLYSATSS